MGFQIGQQVCWTSQAGGSTKTKQGVIVHVVPAGDVPPRERFLSLHRGNGIGGPRNRESYVVKVGSKVYWPRVSGLRVEATVIKCWKPIGRAPVGKTMFLVMARRDGYDTDPYVVWQPESGVFTRWPHSFQPTHYTEIPPFDADPDQASLP